MTHLSSVSAVTCSAALIAGMVVALLGSLKLSLAQRLQISAARAEGLLAALNLALIPMILLSGLLLDWLSPRQILIGGALLLTCGLSSLTLHRTYLAALVSLLLIGLGTACLHVGSVVLMPIAFGFPREELAASVNLGFVFLALGALMVPTLTDLLLRTVAFRRTLALLALLCLVLGLGAFLSFRDAAGAAFTLSDQPVAMDAVCSDFYLWLIAVAFLCYAPLEFLVSSWGTTYLKSDRGLSEHGAVRVMTWFWLAFLASRVLFASVVRLGLSSLGLSIAGILLLPLVAAVLLGNLLALSRPQTAAWGLILLGFVLGPIGPTLAAFALGHFPHNSGTAYGLVFAAGSLGSVLVTPLYGAIAQRGSTLKALRLLTPLALLLALVGLAICLTMTRVI